MRLYFPVDLTGNLIMIEKLVLGEIWTRDFPIFNPDALTSAPYNILIRYCLNKNSLFQRAGGFSECKCKLILTYMEALQKIHAIELSLYLQCQMMPQNMWLHTAGGCNHQSLACLTALVTALMFSCSGTQIYPAACLCTHLLQLVHLIEFILTPWPHYTPP